MHGRDEGGRGRSRGRFTAEQERVGRMVASFDARRLWRHSSAAAVVLLLQWARESERKGKWERRLRRAQSSTSQLRLAVGVAAVAVACQPCKGGEWWQEQG